MRSWHMREEIILLIAIPTYERCIDIDRLLKAISFISAYTNVKVVIFDSSKDNETEKTTNDYMRRGFNNLSYEKLDERIPSNEKVFLIYERYVNTCEYMWILHDHTIFTQESFDYLINNLRFGYDFIYLQMQGDRYNSKEYDDRQVFAQKNAWLIGKIGASIVRTSTLIKDVNWEYYSKKYLTNININFSHVGFYLERISEKDFSILEVEFPRSQFTDTHKYEKLSWEKEALRICTECWGSVIMSLPETYSDKRSIISTIDQYFLNIYKLLLGRLHGYYTIDDYNKYEKWIKLVFPNLLKDAYNIATLSEDILIEKYVKPFKDRIKDELNSGRDIYIYGAGKHGIECLELMEVADISPKGFIVSDMAGNPENIRGTKVYELRYVLQENKPIFAILAVMEKLQKEIVELIKKEVDMGQDITWIKY